MDTEAQAALEAVRARVRSAQNQCRRAGQELARAAGGFTTIAHGRVRTPADAAKATELIMAAQATHGEVDVLVLAPHPTTAPNGAQEDT